MGAFDFEHLDCSEEFDDLGFCTLSIIELYKLNPYNLHQAFFRLNTKYRTFSKIVKNSNWVSIFVFIQTSPFASKPVVPESERKTGKQDLFVH